MPDLPTTSVVIPTHGRRALLEDVLAPVLADPATTEVVVVVDGCDDGSIELVEELRRHDERLVARWAENGGPSAARQAGVEAASGEVVVLLDDDVVAEPGLVAGHARAHADRDGIVVVGYAPVEAPEDSARDTIAVDLYDAWYEECVAGYEARPESLLENYWAGNASLRRRDALRVGLHSPVMAPTYNEDRDFGLRCREAGLRATFDRRLRARHRYRRSFAALRRDAHTSGVGRWRIHDEHGDVVGSLPSDAFAAGLPPVRAALVGLSRRPRLRRLLRTGLAGAVARHDAARATGGALGRRAPRPAHRPAEGGDRRVARGPRVRCRSPWSSRPTTARRWSAEPSRACSASTARPAEVIVVDDCSTDDTGASRRELGARVIRHAVNRGEGGARNTGIARGRRSRGSRCSTPTTSGCRTTSRRSGRSRPATSSSPALRRRRRGRRPPRSPTASPGRGRACCARPRRRDLPRELRPAERGPAAPRDGARRAAASTPRCKRCADLDLWLRMLERGRGVVSPAVTGDLPPARRPGLGRRDGHAGRPRRGPRRLRGAALVHRRPPRPVRRSPRLGPRPRAAGGGRPRRRRARPATRAARPAARGRAPARARCCAAVRGRARPPSSPRGSRDDPLLSSR